MRVIISGGLGYVGGRVSEALAGSGMEVIALSRQTEILKSVKWPDGLIVMHPEALLPGNITADAFIHLAAMNENDCVKNPEGAIEVNITQTVKWLEWSAQRGIKRFIYFSTAHVYGKPLEGTYDETSLTVPIHPYAITHKCAEDYVVAYHRERNMQNIVFRLSNAFGAPAFPTADRWTLLVNDLCKSAVSDSRMSLASDGSQLRDFICLEDVCAGLKLVLNQEIDDAYPVYNLSSGVAESVFQMASQIRDIATRYLDRPIELTRKVAGAPTKQPGLQLSNEKLRAVGFSPRNNTLKEIETTLEFFKQYYAAK